MIFKSLLEAEATSSKDEMTEIEIDDDNENSDYTEDISGEEEQTVDDNDDVEDDNDDTEDDGTEEENNDEEDTDYTESIDETDVDNSTDDDMGGETTDDASGDETTDSENPEASVDDVKNFKLIDDMISLYYNIRDSIDKLNTVIPVERETAKVIISVKSNFTKLSEQIFNYITLRFNQSSYVENLYMFNNSIEAYKINVKLLEKIGIFGSNA